MNALLLFGCRYFGCGGIEVPRARTDPPEARKEHPNDQCELRVDRGDGKGVVLLAIDTTGYTDTQPFPNAPASGPIRLSTASGTAAWDNGAARSASPSASKL